jgi:hypothetical protein
MAATGLENVMRHIYRLSAAPAGETPSDVELLQRAVKREREAWEILVRRHLALAKNQNTDMAGAYARTARHQPLDLGERAPCDRKLPIGSKIDAPVNTDRARPKQIRPAADPDLENIGEGNTMLICNADTAVIRHGGRSQQLAESFAMTGTSCCQSDQKNRPRAPCCARTLWTVQPPAFPQ